MVRSKRGLVEVDKQRKVMVVKISFIEVCTCYSELMHTQMFSFQDRLNFLSANEQLRDEYVKGYPVSVGSIRY